MSSNDSFISFAFFSYEKTRNSPHFLEILNVSILFISYNPPIWFGRASQIHGVPRKTLRNWMKRWHIKSVYPMPYQLKRAAEKKRQTVQKNETQASTSAQRDSPEIIESNDC